MALSTACFNKNEKLIKSSISVQLMFFSQKYYLVIFSRFPVLIEFANGNINKIFKIRGHFAYIQKIFEFEKKEI